VTHSWVTFIFLKEDVMDFKILRQKFDKWLIKYDLQIGVGILTFAVLFVVGFLGAIL